MDLSGRFVFGIPWIETQPVVVTRHGPVFILRLRDRFDRYRIFESRFVGYNVTEFKPRLTELPRLVVLGAWEKAFYTDERGRQYDVTIDGPQKEDQKNSRAAD